MPLRGVHLDLKGMPPTPKRLLELLGLYAALGLNVVLIEWEDTFPWARYPELRSPTAYSRAHLKTFLRRADKLGLTLIPLVQCLGHMENVLRHSRFAPLRENPDDVSELCPSKPGSAHLVISLIDDVLTLMNPAWFHLGGDEAWHMASCPRCKKAVKTKGKDRLYLQHITPILEHLNARGIRPVLWDDMMRKWPASRLKALGRRADLMAWSYDANPVKTWRDWFSEKHLARYRRLGVNAWAGSCYKGADGPHADVPKTDTRAANNLAWARLCRKHRLIGQVATGWSRYNTFASPCESIEVSLDSLVLAAATMWDGTLPGDPGKAAQGWLKHYKGGRELRRFKNCIAAARALSEWRKGPIHRMLDHAPRSARLCGEPERTNPAWVKRFQQGIETEFKRGHGLANAFVCAHQGCVPDRWLKLYVKSRLMPFQRAYDLLAQSVARR